MTDRLYFGTEKKLHEYIRSSRRVHSPEGVPEQTRPRRQVSPELNGWQAGHPARSTRSTRSTRPAARRGHSRHWRHSKRRHSPHTAPPGGARPRPAGTWQYPDTLSGAVYRGGGHDEGSVMLQAQRAARPRDVITDCDDPQPGFARTLVHADDTHYCRRTNPC